MEGCLCLFLSRFLNPAPSVLITLLEYLLQLLLLRTRQAVGELDLNAYHEVAPLIGLLRFGHAEVGVSFRPGRACGAAAAYAELLVVDCLDGAAPACEGFFEVELDYVFDVVAFAGENCVWFLKIC